MTSASVVEDLYAKVGALDVEMRFEPEFGFPYLQTKLIEVHEKADAAARLMIEVTQILDRVGQEYTVEAARFDATGDRQYRTTAEDRRALVQRLRLVRTALTVRRERLHRLPFDIRLHTKLLEDMLELERRHRVDQGRVRRQQACESALSQAAEHPDDLDGLFDGTGSGSHQ